MPRFFFHVHDVVEVDKEGTELRDLQAARAEAARLAGAAMNENPGKFLGGEPWSVDVHDDQGQWVFTLHFSLAGSLVQQ